MKFDELFDTLMEACYSHNKRVKKEAHCGTHGEKSSGSRVKGQQEDEMDAKAEEYAKAQRKKAKKDGKKEESDEDVAGRTPPYDELNKADFLPPEVRKKINKEK